MDTLVSTFSAFEVKEVCPLVPVWAVFLYQLSTPPGKDEKNELMEFGHIDYICQAFEVGSLHYCSEILQCNL